MQTDQDSLPDSSFEIKIVTEPTLQSPTIEEEDSQPTHADQEQEQQESLHFNAPAENFVPYHHEYGAPGEDNFAQDSNLRTLPPSLNDNSTLSTQTTHTQAESGDSQNARLPSSKETRKILDLWEVLKKDPAKFGTWEHLIKESEILINQAEVEGLDPEQNLREAYTGILKNFPLCYGYWKKLAEFENQRQGVFKAIEVGTSCMIP